MWGASFIQGIWSPKCKVCPAYTCCFLSESMAEVTGLWGHIRMWGAQICHSVEEHSSVSVLPTPRDWQRTHHSWARVPEEKSKESTGERSSLFHQRNTPRASLCSGGGVVTKPAPTRVTPWTGACQAPLAIGFSRQECWGGFPFPSPEDLPDPGIKPGSPALQAESLPIELRGKP